MDTELARTFLTVVAEGNFIAASERLHVAPSTVSARIQALEDLLRCRLFTRNKAGAALTPAGRQFQRHAAVLVRTAEKAQQDVGLPRGFQDSLRIGGRFGLWDDLLQRCLPLLRQRLPDISLRAEVGFEDELLLGLVDGRLDLAVMYTPQARPGLNVEHLLDEQLVLVTSGADGGPGLGSGYVHVDWGPEFTARHAASFADFTGPAVSANIGWLALQHILAADGSAYLPERLVRRPVEEGRLSRSPNAPTFTLPGYVVYPNESIPGTLRTALATIREVAASVELDSRSRL